MNSPAPDLGELEAFLSQLSREPDFDAPELRAYDAADLLLLSESQRWILRSARRPQDDVGSDTSVILREPADTAVILRERLDTPVILRERSESQDPSGQAVDGLVVVGDRHGALTLGAAHAFGTTDIRVHQDPLLSERALAANAAGLGLADTFESLPLGEGLLSGAKFVLLQLPKSLAELEEISWNVARYAAPDVVLLAGGRDKHMTRGMNELLARHFGEVTASRGWRKARVLTARSPLPSEALGHPRFPERGADRELDFELFATGATFGGATLDHGSRLLLRTLREQPPARLPEHIADIGCGNGVLAVSAALAYPTASVIASDQSAAAVQSTLLTATAADVEDRLSVFRADATEAVPQGWADLVLLNPPFHAGSTVHVGVGQRLIRSCARALASGGELRLVFNSHLGYRSLIEREIGPTRQLARDKTFTVLAAVKR